MATDDNRKIDPEAPVWQFDRTPIGGHRLASANEIDPSDPTKLRDRAEQNHK